jgi:hypothetical protein
MANRKQSLANTVYLNNCNNRPCNLFDYLRKVSYENQTQFVWSRFINNGNFNDYLWM